jgi:hypothetical protein
LVFGFGGGGGVFACLRFLRITHNLKLAKILSPTLGTQHPPNLETKFQGTCARRASWPTRSSSRATSRSRSRRWRPRLACRRSSSTRSGFWGAWWS